MTTTTEATIEQIREAIGTVREYIESLQAQNANLRERLEIAESPALDECPDDREPWPFRFQHEDLHEVEKAIAGILGRKFCHGDDRDADALAEVCRMFNGRGYAAGLVNKVRESVPR